VPNSVLHFIINVKEEFDRLYFVKRVQKNSLAPAGWKSMTVLPLISLEVGSKFIIIFVAFMVNKYYLLLQ